MTRQVALLRGINLGRNNRVDMARVRALVQDLGYERVRTHLQSGNIVFTAAATPPERAAHDIQEQLGLHLGLSVPVVVRSRHELAEILGRKPLPDAEIDPARFLVTFLSASADPAALRELEPAAFEPDQFWVDGREIFQWHPNGVRNSKLTNTFWEKRLQVTATARNWNTVTRLLELADE
jgi:uncharacterized protein (DUF1697 family)